MNDLFPECVRRIGIPAPAGLPDRALLERSCAMLASFGIETCLGEHIFSPSEESYFASSKENRAADFNRFLHDDSIDLILCARGGYGSMQLLPLIDWETLRKRRLPVVGFSDITALHLAMLAKEAGIPVASQMAARLCVSLENGPTADSMRRVLHLAFSRGGTDFGEIARLRVLRETAGEVSGRIVCANLTMLSVMMGTGYLPPFRDAVVILEDIGEEPRKIDRALVQFQLAGLFDGAAAVIFGDFTDCGIEEEIFRVMRRFAENAGVPVYAGLNFGHGIPSLSFLCGEEAVIRNGTLFCRTV